MPGRSVATVGRSSKVRLDSAPSLAILVAGAAKGGEKSVADLGSEELRATLSTMPQIGLPMRGSSCCIWPNGDSAHAFGLVEVPSQRRREPHGAGGILAMLLGELLKLVWTTICYVNPTLFATVAAKIFRPVNNPG
jgi:hypothetical protein